MQVDRIAAAGGVDELGELTGLVTIELGRMQAFMAQRGPQHRALGGVVENDVHDHFDARAVQAAHQGFELRDRVVDGVTRVGYEKSRRVVAPVVGQPQLRQARLGHEGHARHQLHCVHAQIPQVIHAGVMRQPQVGAAQLGRYRRVLLTEAFDVGLVEHGVGPGDFRARAALPVKGGPIRRQGLGHVRGAVDLAGLQAALVLGVVGHQVRVGLERTTQSRGVGIDQQFPRVEQQPLFRFERAFGAKAVAYATAQSGHEAVPDVAAAGGQVVTLHFPILVVEQTQHQVAGLGAVDGEIHPAVARFGAHGVGPAGRHLGIRIDTRDHDASLSGSGASGERGRRLLTFQVDRGQRRQVHDQAVR